MAVTHASRVASPANRVAQKAQSSEPQEVPSRSPGGSTCLASAQSDGCCPLGHIARLHIGVVPVLAYASAGYAIFDFQRRPALAAAVAERTEIGWFGYRRDKANVTDGALGTFREFMPLLVIAAALSVCGKQLVLHCVRLRSRGRRTPHETDAACMRAQLVWKVVFALILWICIFGRTVLFPLAWVCITYALSPLTSGSNMPIGVHITAAWLVNISLLATMHQASLPRAIDLALGQMGVHEAIVDWHIVTYFMALRSLSFVLDCCDVATPHKARFTRPMEISTLPDANECTFAMCIAYCLYPPFYIGGPIHRFADFARQHVGDADRGEEELQPARVLRYALRYVFAWTIFEFMLHVLWPSAILEFAQEPEKRGAVSEEPIWGLGFSCALSWVVLTITWFKFLLPWRFFRLWGMCDGVLAPEEISHCMSNNCTIKEFWQNFHATYNKFLVRYIYVPLGGAHSGVLRQTIGVILTFGFVVFTHDPRFTHLDKYPWWCSIFVSGYIVENVALAAIDRLSGSGKVLWTSAFARGMTIKERVRVQVARVLTDCRGGATIIALMLGNMLSYGFESGSSGFRFLTGAGEKSIDAGFAYWFIIFSMGTDVMYHMRQKIRDGCKKDSSPKGAHAFGKRWRVSAATCFCAAVVAPAVGGAIFFDGTWWEPLTYKWGWPHDSYEACELVRYNSFVRAPMNAWSSFVCLLMPVYVILYGRCWSSLAWALFGSKGPHEQEEGVGLALCCAWYLQCMVMAVGLAYASFNYHASITNDMNYMDVRYMFITLGSQVWVDTAALLGMWFGPENFLQGVVPSYMLTVVLYNMVAMYTDFFNHRFGVFIPILFILNVLFNFIHARLHWRDASCNAVDDSVNHQALGRRRMFAGVAILIGALVKAIDDSRFLCSESLRASPFQLTAIFHVLVMGGMCTGWTGSLTRFEQFVLVKSKGQ